MFTRDNRLPKQRAGQFACMLVATAMLLAIGSRLAAAKRPNILVILVDTLRKDHLSLYGYERQTSSTIDALGEQGWVLENHIANASQTVPSTLSMLLSRHPAEHGILHLRDGHFATLLENL